MYFVTAICRHMDMNDSLASLNIPLHEHEKTEILNPCYLKYFCGKRHLLCICSLFSLNIGLSVLYIFVSCNHGHQWDFIVKFDYVLSEITTKYCMCNLM